MKSFSWVVALFGVLAFSIYSYDRVEHSEMVRLRSENKKLTAKLEESRGKVRGLEEQIAKISKTGDQETASVKDEKAEAAAKTSS